jgi:hypothetical protein
VRDLVGVYYALIRSLLREKPHLRAYLKRCKHCRIFFFTHPRNAAREDLRCGFGCREAHRRKNSTRRSVEFYRENKDKKRRLNRRRYLLPAQPLVESRAQQPPRTVDVEDVADAKPVPPILYHVRILISLIEGRRVGLDEIVAMLARNQRQHRMARERRLDYVVRQLRDRGS